MPTRIQLLRLPCGRPKPPSVTPRLRAAAICVIAVAFASLSATSCGPTPQTGAVTAAGLPTEGGAPPAPGASANERSRPVSTVKAIPQDESALAAPKDEPPISPTDDAPKEPVAPTAKRRARIVSPNGTKLAKGAWLASPCVDPQTDAAWRAKRDDDNPPTADETADLDGDGIDDWSVFLGASSITDAQSLYVRRGSCGHYVGTVSSSANLRFTQTRTRGLLELSGRSRCQVDCCAHDVIETWAFDGVAYRKVKEEKLPPCKSQRFAP